MSLALYRKYRPGTFAEVIGQEHVTGPVCTAIDSGRIHHAYLFSGPRGCGKTSSARILARSLNCEQGPTSKPCGVCDSCVALAPMGGGSIDVIEIDAASHGLVDDARDLREKAHYAPVASRFKIYVIDEAHMITTAAFNALLKVVEEPPPHVKFIFATTEPDKVLTTIKSRTFHYRFRLIPPQTMRDHLAQLCEREGINIDPTVLPLIVRAGGGSARDAQSILDQLSAGAGDEGVNYERALSLLGYTDLALQDEVVDAFAAGDGAAVFRAVDRVIEAGLEPRRFAQDLLERFRDLLVLDAVPDAADNGLLDAPSDQLDRMRHQAERYGRPSLSRAADVMATALVDMRGTTSPRLVLELACARILLPGAASDTSALLVRLDNLERRMAATGVAPSPAAAAAPVTPAAPAAPAVVTAPAAAPVAEPEPTTAPELASLANASAGASDAAEPTVSTNDSAEAPGAAEPAPVVVPIDSRAGGAEPGHPVAAAPAPVIETPASAPAAAPSAPGQLDLVGLKRLWDAVLDAVKKRSRTAHALMMSSDIQSLDGNVLTLSFRTATLATRFANDVADFVTEALTEVVGLPLKVNATSGDVPGQAASGGYGGMASDSGSAAGTPYPASAPTAPPTAAERAVQDEPDEDDLADSDDIESVNIVDPADAALALLKDGLGAQVIGEIDAS